VCAVDRWRGLLPDAWACKTALAAAVAWELGRRLPGTSHPYFAAMAAILTLHISVAESVSRGLQRMLGVVSGVLLALEAARLMGASAWSLGALVLAALTVGRWLRLGPLGTPQVAVSALLVMAIGGQARWGYALDRALETAAGAAIGVAVNALVAPPSHVPAAEQALRALAEALAGVLRDLARRLPPSLVAAEAELHRSRALSRAIDGARAALALAEESLRFNPLAGGEQRRLRQLRHAFAGLEHAALQVRGMARALRDALVAADGWDPEPLRDVVAAAAEVVEGFWRAVDLGRSEDRARVEAAVRAARRAVAAAEARLARPAGWVRLGSLLADAERLITDLATTLAAVG
jgi:uncharacterized membrane protein YgaE (UPF0421/DUF939 family)